MQHLVLPHTREVFLRLLEQYSEAIWPLQLFVYALGLLIVASIAWPYKASDRLISGLLAAIWLWLGIVYHAIYYFTINWVGGVFTLFFVLEGVLFVWTGLLHGALRFRLTKDPVGRFAVCLIVIALSALPLAFLALHYPLSNAPLLATATYPTTLFTLGVLLLADARAPWHLLTIPILWAFAAGAMEWETGAPYAWIMPLAGIATAAVAFQKNRLGPKSTA